ncbi:MAG: hypothetical protein GX591_11805 [Planctomycetes bacterium]|nr:hypothetical protein [Planctomycetota bacterium]
MDVRFESHLSPTWLLALAAVLAAALAVHAVRRRRRRGAGVVLAAAALTAAAVAVFPARPMLAMALAAGWVSAAVVVFYAATDERLSPRSKAVLAALRLGAIAALFVLLTKPVLVSPPPRGRPSEKPVLAVLVDRSASMATVDDPGAPSRHAQALGALRGRLDRMIGAFDLRWYAFAAVAAGADDLPALAAHPPEGPDSEATDLAGALRAAAATAVPPSAILVLSDGIATGDGRPRRVAAALRTPIYTLAIGSRRTRTPGVRIDRIDAPAETLRGEPCPVTVHLAAGGAADQALEVRLLEGERLLDRATVLAAADEPACRAELSFVPTHDNAAGEGPDVRRRLTVRVASPAAADDAEIHVLVGDRRIGVLYVDSIRPAYKFLAAALRRDPTVEAVTLVHLAEDTFVASGRRAGVNLEGLPDSLEQWKAFDVVILGDVDRTRWSDRQLEQLAAFVRDGGGLAMIGGAGSFGPGGYGAGPLADLLPVRCGGRDIGAVEAPFAVRLTADGAADPLTAFLAEGLDGPGDRAAPAPLPAADGCVRTEGLTAGAVALAVHPTEGLPVLAVGRAGRGRTLAHTAFGTWRWHMDRAGGGQASPYERFWRQAVRYLAGDQIQAPDVPVVVGRTEAPFVEAGAPLALAASTRGGPSAEVAVEVRCGRDVPATIPLRRTEGGSFVGAMDGPDGGPCILRFVMRDMAGEVLDSDELPLRVVARSTERQRLIRDDAMLADVAARSGGAAGDLLAWGPLLETMIDRTRPAREEPVAAAVRLHDGPIGLALVVVLLTVEWILRRRLQLR